MAATGYTPIQLYYSTTASAAPTAANLLPGELGLNITDGKLYYEDNLGAVQLLASKSAATGSVSSVALSGGTTGITVSGSPITTSGTMTLAGTLVVANGGTGATTLASGGYLKGAGTSAITSQSGIPAGDITSGTLAVARGGTGASSLTANNVLLGNGTSAVQVVAPGTSGNVLTSNGTTWTSAASTGVTTGKSIAMAMIFGF